MPGSSCRRAPTTTSSRCWSGSASNTRSGSWSRRLTPSWRSSLARRTSSRRSGPRWRSRGRRPSRSGPTRPRPTPGSWNTASRACGRRLCATCVADDRSWRFPVVVKPVAGSASVGVRKIATRDELATLGTLSGLVVEECAPGDEHSIDVLVDRAGTVRDVVVRRRVEVRAGEVSKGITVHDAEIMDLASAVAEALPDAYGVLTVQLFRDPRDRSMRVIEINARFGGGFPTGVAGRGAVPAVAPRGTGWSPRARACPGHGATAWSCSATTTRSSSMPGGSVCDPGSVSRVVCRARSRRHGVPRARLRAERVRCRGCVGPGSLRDGWLRDTARGSASSTGSAATRSTRSSTSSASFRTRNWLPTSSPCTAAHEPNIQLLPDARATIARLQPAATLAVITDGPLASQRAKARAMETDRWSTATVFTADWGSEFGKPHPRAFEQIERMTGVRGASCAYLADNPVKDFAAPRQLGWHTIRVRRPGSLHESVGPGDDVDAEARDLAAAVAELNRRGGGLHGEGRATSPRLTRACGSCSCLSSGRSSTPGERRSASAPTDRGSTPWSATGSGTSRSARRPAGSTSPPTPAPWPSCGGCSAGNAPTCCTPTIRSPASTGGCSVASRACRSWSTLCTVSTRPKTTGPSNAPSCTRSRRSHPGSPTPSSCRTPRTSR